MPPTTPPITASVLDDDVGDRGIVGAVDDDDDAEADDTSIDDTSIDDNSEVVDDKDDWYVEDDE